jgi:hypothetical protein
VTPHVQQQVVGLDVPAGGQGRAGTGTGQVARQDVSTTAAGLVIWQGVGRWGGVGWGGVRWEQEVVPLDVS